jgi:hypothetical protein
MEGICSLVNNKFGLEIGISELEKFYVRVQEQREVNLLEVEE